MYKYYIEEPTAAHFPGGRYLHVNQLEVQPFLLHQFAVAALLHDDSIFEACDDICISDCRQSVSNHNGGPAFSGLKGKRTNTWGSRFTKSTHCKLAGTVKHWDGHACGW